MDKKLKERVESEQRAMRPITNADLICRDCKYMRSDVVIRGNVSFCDAYGDQFKPNSVFTRGVCPRYKKEEEDGQSSRSQN